MEVVDLQGSTAQAVADLEAKQKRRARWSRIGGGLLFVAIAVRLGGALFGHASAPDCDDSAVQSTLTALVDKAAAKGGTSARVAKLEGETATAHSDTLNRCRARITMSDQSNGTITYHVDQKNVVVDAIDG